jgi:hypothetical protein
MHRLNGLHAERFNQRHHRTGHLFGDRLASWLIEDDDYLGAACQYVLENPVRAGLSLDALHEPVRANGVGRKTGIGRVILVSDFLRGGLGPPRRKWPWAASRFALDD